LAWLRHDRKACFGYEKAAKKALPGRSPAALTGLRANGNAQTTGHAMTVAVGDGRGFSSLAAAPDGRAPARCTARSWPGRLSASKPLALKRWRVPEKIRT
jgi:hypothetical protein